MILGITGSIAAGKSYVAQIFKELGVPVVSADELARDVVSPGQPALEALQRRFGAAIISTTGELDRARLAQQIFSDPAARQDLNQIVHPAITTLAKQTLRELQAAGHPLIVYEAPLLFEAKAEERVDAVLMVRIDPELQRQRLRRRDKLDDTEITARIAAQLPQAEKVARADYVIDNSGPPEATRTLVKELFDRLS